MVFIDGTVVNIALPALQASLNATAVDVQWVVESYALFLAALLFARRFVGRSLGRPAHYSIGGGAVRAGFDLVRPGTKHQSTNILARAVQGIGGALLVPGGLAIISASFPEEERGRAIGTGMVQLDCDHHRFGSGFLADG